MADMSRGRTKRRSGRTCMPTLLAVCLLLNVSSARAHAQTDSPADRGGVNIFAGILASSFTVRYNGQKIQGPAVLIDVAGKSSLGLEAEARWLSMAQSNDAHASTWLVGPRYRWKNDRYQVYVKALAGIGQARGLPDVSVNNRSTVLAPGGGVDFTLIGRLRVRLVDVEYQYWPQNALSPMASYGISAGLRLRIY